MRAPAVLWILRLVLSLGAWAGEFSDEVLVGQLQWVALRPPVLPPRTRQPTEAVLRLIRTVRPGGVILFLENLQSPQQLASLMEALQRESPVPLLFAIDEEGGTVTRLARLPAFRFSHRPPAPRQAALPLAEFESMVRGLAQDLKKHSLLVNLAPVADMDLRPGNPMRLRSYGSDPQLVAERVGAWIRIFTQEGVASVVKHFPGLGTTLVDTHHGAVRLEIPPSLWMEQEGRVFRSAIEAGTPLLMLAHVAWPALDPHSELIAFSSAVLDGLLRQRLGFQGLILTDALDMAGVPGEVEQDWAAVRAVRAGVDIVAMSTQPVEVHRALLREYRQSPDFARRVRESFQRQRALKRQLLGPHPALEP